MKVKYPYKIHGLNTVNGTSRSIKTNKFYETLVEARKVAQACVSRSACSSRPCNGIVIFQAIEAIVPECSPVVTHPIEVNEDDCG